MIGKAMPSSGAVIFPPIPAETVQSAQSVLDGSNFYLAVGDEVDSLFDGIELAERSERLAEPPRTLAMLYLITIFQFVEALPDRQAADALLARIDWKYALHLPLAYTGLPAQTLCAFRRWLKSEMDGRQDLQTLLRRLPEVTEGSAGAYPGLDSQAVITFVCQISRLANIWEVLHEAIEALASQHPDWLLSTSRPHWILRYGPQQRRLELTGKSREESALAQAIGTDGYYLLEAIARDSDPELADLQEVRALRTLWRQQFERMGDQVLWRNEACAGCSMLELSPDTARVQSRADRRCDE